MPRGLSDMNLLEASSSHRITLISGARSSVCPDFGYTEKCIISWAKPARQPVCQFPRMDHPTNMICVLFVTRPHASE